MPLDPLLLDWLSKAPLVVLAAAFVYMSLYLFKVLVNDINHDTKAIREDIASMKNGQQAQNAISERTAATLERIERKLEIPR